MGHTDEYANLFIHYVGQFTSYSDNGYSKIALGHSKIQKAYKIHSVYEVELWRVRDPKHSHSVSHIGTVLVIVLNFKLHYTHESLAGVSVRVTE